jgi:hypothetical protein
MRLSVAVDRLVIVPTTFRNVIVTKRDAVADATAGIAGAGARRLTAWRLR